jgi:heme-degrading monooxygenase HmoA
MYVRIGTAQIKPGMLDELSEAMIQTFQEGAALARQIPGFLGHQFMINRESNTFAIISRWTNPADEMANRVNQAQQQTEALGAYLAGRPSVEVFEVRFEL